MNNVLLLTFMMLNPQYQGMTIPKPAYYYNSFNNQITISFRIPLDSKPVAPWRKKARRDIKR